MTSRIRGRVPRVRRGARSRAGARRAPPTSPCLIIAVADALDQAAQVVAEPRRHRAPGAALEPLDEPADQAHAVLEREPRVALPPVGPDGRRGRGRPRSAAAPTRPGDVASRLAGPQGVEDRQPQGGLDRRAPGGRPRSARGSPRAPTSWRGVWRSRSSSARDSPPSRTGKRSRSALARVAGVAVEREPEVVGVERRPAAARRRPAGRGRPGSGSACAAGCGPSGLPSASVGVGRPR